MPRVVVSVVICWLLASGAQAATLAGMTLPDTYDVDGQSLALNGAGLRTFTIFRIKGYVAGLYLRRPTHDAQAILASAEPKVLVLRFVRAASKDQVEEEYRKGEATNCGHGECSPSDEADFERLVAAAPGVNPGDTSTFVFTDGRVRVFANDRLIGDFADRDLAHHLLAGFIGDHPPTEELRRALLGLPAD